MSEDRWTHLLAQSGADESEVLDDPRWIKLAEGKLDAREIAALEALAAANPTARRALELYRPVSPATIAQTRVALDRLVDGELTPSRRVGGLAIGAVLAASAVLGVWFSVRLSAVESLPAYVLRLEGGLARARGEQRQEAALDPAGPRELGPATALELVLQPAQAAAQEVRCAAFAMVGERRLGWTPRFEQSPGGSCRWAGTGSELLAEAQGQVELVVWVGPAEVVEAERAAKGDPRRPRHQEIQVFLRPLTLSARPLEGDSQKE